MDVLISTFHIDWKLMLAQLFNFGIVFFFIYYLGAKPIRNLMDKRKEEIEEGLENAKEAKEKLKNADIKKEEIIHSAKTEANTILVHSEKKGKKLIEEAKKVILKEKDDSLAQAKIDIEREKNKAEEEIKKESGILIKEGIKKIVEGYVAKGKGDDLIEAMLDNSFLKLNERK